MFRSLVLKKQDDIEQKRKLNCLILLGPAIKQVWKELSFCHKLNFLNPISSQSGSSVNLFSLFIRFPYFSVLASLKIFFSIFLIYLLFSFLLIYPLWHSHDFLSLFLCIISLQILFSSTPLVASPLLLFILSYFLHSVSFLILFSSVSFFFLLLSHSYLHILFLVIHPQNLSSNNSLLYFLFPLLFFFQHI